MTFLSRIFRSAFRLALTGLCSVGIGRAMVPFVGDAASAFLFAGIAMVVIALLLHLNRSFGGKGYAVSNPFDHAEKHQDELLQGWAYDNGPYADWYDGDRAFDTRGGRN